MRCLGPRAIQQAPTMALPHPFLRSPWVSPDVSCCLQELQSPLSSPWTLPGAPSCLPVGTPLSLSHHGGWASHPALQTGPAAFKLMGFKLGAPRPSNTRGRSGSVSQGLPVIAPSPGGAELSVVPKGRTSQQVRWLGPGPGLHALTGYPVLAADDLDVRYTAVSSFIFLRFFAPAILSPNLFQLTPHHTVSAHLPRGRATRPPGGTLAGGRGVCELLYPREGGHLGQAASVEHGWPP